MMQPPLGATLSSASANLSKMDKVLLRVKRIPCAGILMGLLSGVFFATAGFIVKLLPNVHPIEVVVCRSIIQLFVYVPVILFARHSVKGVPGERWALFARGFFGFISFSLGYSSYHLLSLADASTIIFSAPVYVSVFACLLLKEACGLYQVFSIITTLVGVILISKPSFLFGDHESVKDIEYRLEGSAIAFVSSLCAAFTFVMIRKLQKTPAPVVIFAFSSVSIFCGMIALVILGVYEHNIRLPMEWTSAEWVYLFCNGLCGVFGQLFLTLALKIEEAGLVSLARTIDIVMAFLFEIVFLYEIPHWTSILGAVIICCVVCISGLRKWYYNKQESNKMLRDSVDKTIVSESRLTPDVVVRVEEKVINGGIPANLYPYLKNEKF